MRDVLPPEHYECLVPLIEQAQAGQTVSFDVDVPDLHGDIRHMHVSYVPEAGRDDMPASFHIMVRDQTAQVRLSRMLLDQVRHDELTGLPNRAAWNQELSNAIVRAQIAGTPIAVMFLHLDDFKQINDAHGHAAGDHVLRTFAAALLGTLRPEDIVARLAADVFVVLLDRVVDIDVDPLKIAAKILERVARGTTFEGHHLSMCPSIGIGIQRAPDYDAAASKRAESHTLLVRECGATPSMGDAV